MSRETFILELEAECWPGRAPGIVRLRIALKILLRTFGLKCVSCRQS